MLFRVPVEGIIEGEIKGENQKESKQLSMDSSNYISYLNFLI